jgi:hypothetical protein
MAMVAWPWVDAEHPIHAAARAADNTANWASGTALRRAALHASENALSMSRDRDGEQSRNYGHSEFLPHWYFSMLSTTVRLTLELPRKFPRWARRSAGGRPPAQEIHCLLYNKSSEAADFNGNVAREASRHGFSAIGNAPEPDNRAEYSHLPTRRESGS